MTTRTFTVSGALVSHEVGRYLQVTGINWKDEPVEPHFGRQWRFTVDVDDEQWARIQDWVARCTL